MKIGTVGKVVALAAWGLAMVFSARAQGSGPLQAPAGSPPISLNFQNTEVRALMQVFAEFTGLNFVTTDSVGGQVTVRLQEVPWPQALQVVLQAKGLDARQDGRVVWIAPQDEWLQRERKSLEMQAALEGAMPLQMASMRLQYARASEVAQRLQGAATGGGRPREGAGSARVAR